MPIYEYVCDSCGQLTEAMQKFSDAPLADCEKCGKAGALSKKMSLSSFSLKGTGWYSTDYKKKPEASSKPAETPAPKPESKPSGGGSKDGA